MSITTRQKQIVNPFAEGYDYQSRRNRFIIDAIHERYLYFYSFPEVGDRLNVSPNDNIENPEITLSDMDAYFALYPQNGQMEGNGLRAVELSYDSQLNSLRTLARNLKTRNYLEKYSSKTSEVSYQESFQNNQDVANLVAIPPAHSRAYKDKLRKAFNLPKSQYNEEASLSDISYTPQVNSYMVSNANVDLFDWRNNCLPGSVENVYYNSVDENYYYTARTDEAAFEYMGYRDFNAMRAQHVTGSAAATWEESTQSTKELYNQILSTAIEEILLTTGKNSPENFSILQQKYSPPTRFRIYNHLDTRPGSRWVYAVKIDAIDVDRLPQADSAEPSREDVELTSLQKSRILSGFTRSEGSSTFNRSTRSVSFVISDMIRYVAATREVIKDYDVQSINMGIEEFLHGVNFNRETDNLRSFFSLLALFYNYNKLGLRDEDRVEMFFTDDYQLDHVVINGSFYYQGTGTRTYLNSETEYARVLNAFSVFSPTTFSLIENSQKIYEMAKTVPVEDRPGILDFMDDYIYPKPDREKIKSQQAFKAQQEKDQKARKDKVFQTFKRITQGNPRDFEVLYSNRPLRYTIDSTLQNMDCDSGQAAAIGYALKFWQAAMSKTKLQSVIRQTIILLRDEVVEDELTRRYLTLGSSYAEDPQRIRRDVNNYINQQIACSLDVLGDFLENQFLDPLGLPPSVASLSVTSIDVLPTIEFKKCEMVGVKAMQSKIYQKMIEVVLMNWLKSIVAGLAKDFIKALLGCGPEDDEIELANAFRKEDYGFVNLLDFLDNVDLVEIADNIGLKDSSTTPPKEVNNTQMRAFVEDVSYMTTPVELQQLLTGDASHDLMLHIHETITGDQSVLIKEVVIDDPDDEELVLFSRTRGLDGDEEVTTRVVDTINPDVYNSINFTMDNIRLFFISVGAAMQEALDGLGEAGFNSPLEAFCSKKDGFVNPITLNLSVPEIEAQYNEIVNSKIDKINHFCGFLRDLTNLESYLERLIEDLPILEYYNDLLADIADISNAIAAWIAEKFLALFGEEDRPPQQASGYNLYNSKMGRELFYQIFFSLREVLINQLYFSNGVTYFQTPAGFGSRVGFSVDVPGEDDWLADTDWTVRGNFGARRNAYTDNDVYTFIWSDPRNNSQVAPGRIDLPQFRQPEVPHADGRDAGYYYIGTAPAQLKEQNLTKFTPAALSQIAYGMPGVRAASGYNDGRFRNEVLYIKQVSEIAYENLIDGENVAPYSGYTGATYLRCSNNAGGNIRTFFVNRPNTFPMLSYYQPEDGFYNETSVSSSVANPSKNGDFTSVDYRIFNGTTYTSGNVDYSIRIFVDPGQVQEVLKVNDVALPPLYTGEFIRLYSQYSIGTNLQRRTNNDDVDERSEYILPIQNYRTRIDTLINESVTSDLGRQRMAPYISALNKPALQKSDDICITAQDVFKAEAALKKIQLNFASFFLNIMPMGSAYPNWRSVGTVEIITDYLHRRLLEDLRKKEIEGPFYTLIPFVEKVYPYVEEDPEFSSNPPISSNLTPQLNLKSIVRSVYTGILDNIARTSEYSQVNKSVFDPSTTTFTRYQSLLYEFFKYMKNDGIFPAQQTRLPGGLEAGRALVEKFYHPTKRIPTDLGMRVGSYYFPVAFQIASYMMYMDKGIRYAQRYSDTNYRLRLEEAGADDGVLSAVKGQTVSKFVTSFDNFPVTILGYAPVSTINNDRNPFTLKYIWDQRQQNITYYNTTDIEERIDNLDILLTKPTDQDFTNRIGRLSYSDQIPYFKRDNTTGNYEFTRGHDGKVPEVPLGETGQYYFFWAMETAFRAYVDGYGPDRRPNRPKLIRKAQRLVFLQAGEDERDIDENRDYLTINQFREIVNADPDILIKVFRLARDLTSTEEPYIPLSERANFQYDYSIPRPHAYSRKGIPYPGPNGDPNHPWNRLNRFFGDYVDNRRGREEEDRTWEKFTATFGNDHVGTQLTADGLFLAYMFMETRGPSPQSIEEEKTQLEKLLIR